MQEEPPNWMVLKDCAEELTRAGRTPFTRQDLIAAVQAHFPDRGESSLNPMIQGMTVNLKGGAPGGVGKEVFVSVGRGLFQLLEGAAATGTARDVEDSAARPVREARLPTRPVPTPALTFSSTPPLVLVSCVKSKRSVPAAAQELYISAWFQKAHTYVRSHDLPWFILSAKYGLVDPGMWLDPYELTLNELPVQRRRVWADEVMRDLRPHLQAGQTVLLLAGRRYREFLVPQLEALGYPVETPLAHLPGLGAQQTWIDTHTRRE
ncbi:DUF6884 domain-containing protein [Deinococcus pimensis]|uniref:DUF6884 domain-containing protein n=1 Tax=Deinococcus pimensis TaxID=309888 RepID=UPI0004BA9C8F|nr:DUF6884 domain-containing protein [Deinococcus pimensis]